MVQAAATSMRDAGMGVVSITAAYLRHLWARASAYIANCMKRESLQDLRVQFILTVPTNWPADAAERMEQAALEAGILGTAGRASSVVRMAEAEAAAISALTDIASGAPALAVPTVSFDPLPPRPSYCSRRNDNVLIDWL